MSLAVIVDTGNIYHNVSRKFNGGKLDYRKYLEFVEPMGEPIIKLAFGAQAHKEAGGFISCLQYAGFTPHYKLTRKIKTPKGIKHIANNNVEIAVAMFNSAGTCDRIVLGSNDLDLLPAIEFMTDQGVEVIVLAANIRDRMESAATRCIEIPQSLLEVRDAANKTEGSNMLADISSDAAE